jgi:hypothetical protein
MGIPPPSVLGLRKGAAAVGPAQCLPNKNRASPLNRESATRWGSSAQFPERFLTGYKFCIPQIVHSCSRNSVSCAKA